MKIELTVQQALVVIDLLNKCRIGAEQTTGQILSTINGTYIEWDADKVEIYLPESESP